MVQVGNRWRPPVAVTAGATGGCFDRAVAGITGDTVIGGNIMVPVTGGLISAPRAVGVTGFTVSDCIESQVTGSTIDLLLHPNDIVVLIKCGSGTTGLGPEGIAMAGFAVGDFRQRDVTILTAQLRIQRQLVVVSLTWRTGVTGGALAVFITRDAAVTRGTGYAITGEADHIVVLIQSSAGAVILGPEGGGMTSLTAVLGDQSLVAARTVQRLLDPNLVVVLIDGGHCTAIGRPEGTIVTIFTTADISADTVTETTVNAVGCSKGMVGWAGIATGVTIITAVVENHGAVTGVTIERLVNTDHIVMLIQRITDPAIS